MTRLDLLYSRPLFRFAVELAKAQERTLVFFVPVPPHQCSIAVLTHMVVGRHLTVKGTMPSYVQAYNSCTAFGSLQRIFLDGILQIPTRTGCYSRMESSWNQPKSYIQ